MLTSRPAGTLLDAGFLGDTLAEPSTARTAVRSAVTLSVADNLAAVEADWRAFEADADCTVFQTFDWQQAWLRHVGAPAGTRPAIVSGRDGAGNLLFLMPLAIERRGPVRRLTFLASDLCDYNAPLLAPDFPARIQPGQFAALWRDIGRLLRSDRRFHHHAVVLEKMPETIGGQANPIAALPVTLNPSGAYLAHLDKDWETFYAAKRSSSSRKRDRWKRRRLADHGAVSMVTPEDPTEIALTLETLYRQKSRAFARMGVRNIFERPGYREFYSDIATSLATRSTVHVSRLDVGGSPAAVNFGLVRNSRYYHVLVSYDDGEVSRCGPGAIHLQELLKYAIGRGCGEFDFTIGDEAYKREWCDTEVKLYDLRSAATPFGLAVTLPAAATARAKRIIKHTPFLWRIASRARALAGAKRSARVAESEESESA
jgi:CelD/BcsL family acetyltransferase involved in cellulose biosynthesis